MHLISVNRGRATAVDYTDSEAGLTGHGKVPVPGPVRVFAPGPKGIGASGLEGDEVCDLRHHGGDHQAVYAYAREDLEWWERELDRELPGGIFGENFTTSGVDVNGALLGERWRVGPELVLEVASARIPCRTFQGALDEKGWVKRFTQEARPGAYLRVVQEGSVSPATPSRSCTARTTRSRSGSGSAPSPPSGSCCRARWRPVTRWSRRHGTRRWPTWRSTGSGATRLRL